MKDRKQLVLLNAKKLFIEKGFDETSIQDILGESNISKGTFYNYFSSKNECLINILEIGRKETAIRRQELLIGKDKADAFIFAEQIAIRFQVTQDHNLIPIFETIFHSGDRELRSFAEKHYSAELAWLAHRLLDVYGTSATPYVTDCAVMLLGMLQHMIHAWAKIKLNEKIPNELIHFVVQQTDAIMPKLIEKKQFFFTDDFFLKANDVAVSKPLTTTQLVDQLRIFKDNLKDLKLCEQQYIQFLIDELQEKTPRFYLIESIVKSFRADFINTSTENDVQNLVAHILAYMESKIA